MSFWIGMLIRCCALYFLGKLALFLVEAAYAIDHREHADIRNEIHWERPVRGINRRSEESSALYDGTSRRTVRNELVANRKGE